jgi:hypothetical protein
MTKPNSEDLPFDDQEPERLMARHREQIVQLEAHGTPSEDSDELWDRLAEILAEVKRHRAASDPEA